MAKHSVRDAFRDDPASAAAGAAVGLAFVVLVLVPGYLAVAVLRPRWLTAAARRSPGQWVLAITLRLLFLFWLETRAKPWLERNQRAHTDLRQALATELGREPTIEELMERVEDRS